MNKEFIPYEEALSLKELGFDEPCLCSWNFYTNELNFNPHPSTFHSEDIIQLPTFSQVFRWFREKHGLYTHVVPEFYNDGINFNWQILWYLPKGQWTKHVIHDGTGLYGDNGEYPTQEEAELACLKKLIQIIKDETKKD